MSKNIIIEDIIFNNCRTGTDFENKTLDFLMLAGLTATRTGGANDGGIDIVASVNIHITFNLRASIGTPLDLFQCKISVRFIQINNSIKSTILSKKK